jgi:nucleotide sugar dehydrogenase
MALESRNVTHAGVAVVLDSAGRVLGLVTDGDIRRAYAQDISWTEPISRIMIRRPVTLPVGTHPDQIILELSRAVEKAPHIEDAKTVTHILLVDESNRLIDIQNFFELLWDREERSAQVHVIGMGFVGLTVAVSLANVGHRVTGVDIDTGLLEKLQRGVSPNYEVGLTAKLKHVLEREVINFEPSLKESTSSIYIIAVGVSADSPSQVDLSALQLAGTQLSKVLKPGDQVMLRSTVPVGTTCRFLLPILEGGSNLIVAEELSLVYAPERTLAGNALSELRTLPQLVGGVTPRCTERAARFWATLTHTVAQLSNPEAAELAKLANNSFRNVSFAFANELALLAEEHNLDVAEVIQAANNGYPRNPIPPASPGVGGYCLPKDSLLLAASFSHPDALSRLSIVARTVNDQAGRYPLEIFDRFCAQVDRPVESMCALVIGIAFKGEPETNDLRGSVGLITANALKEKGVKVTVWDAVVDEKQIAAKDLQTVLDLKEAVSQVDCVFLMNNHRNNTNMDMTHLNGDSQTRLIFDGWGLLDRKETEAISGIVYSCPGYMTSFER